MLNFHLIWKTSRYEWLYVCLFVLMVLFCSCFGNRSQQPYVLQLLIEMLIRSSDVGGACPFILELPLLNDFYQLTFTCEMWTLRWNSSKRHSRSFRKPFCHVFNKTRPKWIHCRKPFKCFDLLLLKFDSLHIRMCEFACKAASFIHECGCGVLMTHCPFSWAKQ